MDYTFFAVVLLAIVHLFADRAKKLGGIRHGRLLSLGGGVAIAYVFVDLLSKLGKDEVVVSQALQGVFPIVERHVYVMALLGFLVFYLVDKTEKSKIGYWFTLISYIIFNFFVGYAVSDKNDPEVQPLILFTFAMALHYFTNDYGLSLKYEEKYRNEGRWMLIGALFVGWITGQWYELSATAVALVGSFIAGGVIMNVTRHELPENRHNNSLFFTMSALIYSIILLSIG